MRATLTTLTVLVGTLLACSGAGDLEMPIEPIPAPTDAPAPAPTGSTPSGSGTADSPHQADCSTTALQLGKGVGQTDHVACPASCTTGNVWGTGRYTGDSQVCVAAVHAGALPGAAAGTVIVTFDGSSSSFTGSEANGVTSQSWTTASLLTFSVAPAGAAPAPRDGVRDGKGGKAGGGGGAGDGDGRNKVKGGKNR